MADYNKAVAIVFTNEGGYSDDPDDLYGNYFRGVLIGSKFGISAWTYFHFFHVEPTIELMKALTKEQSLEIYYKNYWLPIKGDRITNDSIASILFDACVNEGLYAGIKGIQEVLQKTNPDIDVDGIFGEMTLAALNNSDQESIFYQFKEYRASEYLRISKEKNNAGFYTGWMTRLNKFVFSN